jgi:hypothetical protein
VNSRQSKKVKNASGREEAGAKEAGKTIPNNVLVDFLLGFHFPSARSLPMTKLLIFPLLLELNLHPHFAQDHLAARFRLPSDPQTNQ